MCLLLLATASLAGSAPQIAPPNVHARLMLLHQELELIRYEMGKPRPLEWRARIAGVAPREVYFQALTLFRKANRLSFEHTREIVDELPPPDGEIKPADVLAVVENALDRIWRVKEKLGISREIAQEVPDPSKTPDDVIVATMRASQQLNMLLDQPFSPAEVYEQLTLAIGYAARLRAQFPGDRIPETPPFESGKIPSDVYRKLLDCFAIIRRIAETSNLSMLSLEVDEGNLPTATPSEVYDVATMLVSELAYLWEQLDNVPPPRPAYYPGRRFPSHVYQRALLLERQLAELDQLVDSRPGWLNRSGRSPTACARS